MYFNPRSPRGGATRPAWQRNGLGAISIHAPHEGERPFGVGDIVSYINFNPRSPRGGATLSGRLDRPLIIFQSTLPTRGSDAQTLTAESAAIVISIHAPHEGERLNLPAGVYANGEFQSTLPTRGSDALYASCRRWRSSFQSTLPTRGSDPSISPFMSRSQYFNPRSPRGGATNDSCRAGLGGSISIHAPHEGERRYRQRYSFCSYRNFNPRSPRGGATIKVIKEYLQ